MLQHDPMEDPRAPLRSARTMYDARPAPVTHYISGNAA